MAAKTTITGKGAIFLVWLTVAAFTSNSWSGTYSGGSGTAEDPYLISTAEDMQAIGANPNDWGSRFMMVNDVNLAAYTGTQFNIIGNSTTKFTGVFDGNDHTISNFTYNTNSGGNIGVFGYVNDANAVIKNLILVDPNVTAGGELYHVACLVGFLEYGSILGCGIEGGSVGPSADGGLVGSNWDGTISNCWVEAAVTGTGDTGGLVGVSVWGNICDCYAAGSVSGNWGTGGLVGYNFEATISSCYATASVSGGDYTGGLVGHNEGTISNCYAAGSVSGGDCTGGLVGWNESSTISNCYAAGSVSGGDYTGGLVGWSDEFYSTICDCFWDVNTTAQASSAGGEGKTTAEMQTAATFLIWTCGNWTIDDANDYPRLAWQNLPGRPLGLFLCDLLEGTGTEDQPYLVRTAEQLNLIGSLSCEWDKHYKLMADIDLSGYPGTVFNPIGYYAGFNDPDNKPFTGVFDGNGHKISNFNYETYEGNVSAGPFGYVDGPNALIKNVGVLNPNVLLRNQFGSGAAGLVVNVGQATITGCWVQGGIVMAGSAGGMILTNSGQLFNCYSTCNVVGYYGTGGLCVVNEGTIKNCYSRGLVNTAKSCSGGGLVGCNHYGTISNCYAAGNVSMSTLGLVGTNWEGIVSNSFWDVNTSGQIDSDGGEGKTTAEMQTMSTFTDAAWDFVDETVNGTEDVWRLCQDGTDYPKLAWQFITLGDFVCPDGVAIEDLDVFTQQWLMEKLSADVAAGGGDGIVDFLDWAVFASTWQNTAGLAEVLEFAQQWLQTGAYCADIAPGAGDGWVNMLDFAVLAENWLSGVGQ